MRRTLFPFRSFVLHAGLGVAIALGAVACGASDGPVQLRLGACMLPATQPASVRVDVQPFTGDGSALPLVSRLFEIPQGALDDGVATVAYERPADADTANVTVTWFEQPQGMGGSVVAIYLGVEVPGRGATWELGVDACGGVASTSGDTAGTDSGGTNTAGGTTATTATTGTATSDSSTTGEPTTTSSTTDATITGSTSDATATGSTTTDGSSTSASTGMTDPTSSSTSGSTTDATATDSDTSSDLPMVGTACTMEGVLFCDPDTRDPQRVGTLLSCDQGVWQLSDACDDLMLCPGGSAAGCVGEGALWVCLCGTAGGCSELGNTVCNGLSLQLCRPDGGVEVAQCPNDCDVSSPADYRCD
jgi:hypothetical protein